MNAAPTFCYTRLKGTDRNWQPLYEQICASALPALASRGVDLWGAWSGLFGIASNEIVMMTAAQRPDHAAELHAHLQPLPCAVAEQYVLVATVRPTIATQLTRAGLYVLRFFDVYNRDVDEIATLSQRAWTTFETASTYQAQPQGLFCEQDRRAARGIMLLCTWYDGFESWQISREPAPEARANFRRRHELTFATNALAARLIPPIS